MREFDYRTAAAFWGIDDPVTAFQVHAVLGGTPGYRYLLADPIVRFHHVVTRRDLARFEDRRTAVAWADAEPRFRTHVLGPHFEQLARSFPFDHADASTLGGNPADVGPAVVNDAAARTRHEIDVVVIGREPNGATTVLALGEARQTARKRTLADLGRLEHIRGVVAAKHPSAAGAKLLVFSASGFDRSLAAGADRPDIELIDMGRLYLGS